MKEERFSIALKGLEEILKKNDYENLWDIYGMQGFLGLSMASKVLPENVYKEVWTYIKQNKEDLRFYQRIPEDI